MDDMVNVRGVNVYPSAVEGVIRRFAEVAEYRAMVEGKGALPELTVEIELMNGSNGDTALAGRVAAALRDSLGLRVPIRVVPSGALPRFEMKARRFVIGR
jgi:phenylacetate-CoA ligase